ncbi:MAG: MarR family transcriptional regulator [Actinomycetes bacterium]
MVDSIANSKVPTEREPRDQVDQIVAAWQRERPDLDVSALEVLSRITRIARHLDIARRSAFESQGLETWAFDVLAALRRAGAPYELSVGTLLTENLVTSGTMTNRVDKLADLGLVERRPHESDKRVVFVRLTPAGKKHVDTALEVLLSGEEQLLSALDDGQRRDMTVLLSALLSPLDDIFENE